ncbi:MAG: FkbM family methyltransferase [Proteobacteria bacterium]|nr:FkbM family methyltransferase [Pseudomonadota bacterium]
MFSPIGELYSNLDAPLTRRLVEAGAITQFTLIDVGARGGAHPRWNALGPALRVYGFDLFADAFDGLQKDDKHHYFLMALGERDGEIDVVNKSFETMMYAGQALDGEIVEKVQVRKLDTLFKSGTVPPADFIKMDCEGFERYVLDGAEEYLEACDLIGADIESSFHASFHNHRTQFVECQIPLVKQRLIVADMQMTRPHGNAYAERLKGGGEPPLQNVNMPQTLNVLFTRDLWSERFSPANYAFRQPSHKPPVETILKTIAVLEIHCLIAAAFELLEHFKEDLAGAIDVEEARDLLVPKLPDSAWTTHVAAPAIAIRDQTVGDTRGVDLVRELMRRLKARL